MKKANHFIFPCQFTGQYPNNWAGYTFLQLTQQNAYHPGIDWNWGAGEQDYGKPVQCIANGQVVHQSRQDGVGYGIIVVVKHELSDELYNFIKTKYSIDARNIYSFYAHLRDEIVSDGQELEVGELVGYIGKSGTTVSHLHQELYKAVPGTSWRYWPTLSSGWTQAKLKQYYIDTYDLVVNQPQSSQPSETLEQCQTQLKQEIQNKNETYQELTEVKNDLEGEKRQREFLDNVIKQYANILSVAPDTAVIAGELQKMVGNEDTIHKRDKEIEFLNGQVEQSNNLYKELDEKYQTAISEVEAARKALTASDEKYKGLTTLYNKLNKTYEDLKKDLDYKYVPLIWGLYYRKEV